MTDRIPWQTLLVISQIIVWVVLLVFWLSRPKDVEIDVAVLKQSQMEQDKRIDALEQSFRSHVDHDVQFFAHGAPQK